MTASLPSYHFSWDAGLTPSNTALSQHHDEEVNLGKYVDMEPYASSTHTTHQNESSRYGSSTPPPRLSQGMSDEEDHELEGDADLHHHDSLVGTVSIGPGMGMFAGVKMPDASQMYALPDGKFAADPFGYHGVGVPMGMGLAMGMGAPGMGMQMPMMHHPQYPHYTTAAPTSQPAYVPYYNGASGPIPKRMPLMSAASAPYARAPAASSTPSHSTSQYKCTHPSCMRNFSTLAALKSHLRSHAAASTSSNHSSSSSFLASPPRSVTSSSPPPENAPTNNHLRSHACPNCPSTFRRTHDLKRHFRSIHTVEKPYVCGVCRSGFARRDALKRHVGRVGSMCFGGGIVVSGTPEHALAHGVGVGLGQAQDHLPRPQSVGNEH